jgi:hypothetical protein
MAAGRRGHQRTGSHSQRDRVRKVEGPDTGAWRCLFPRAGGRACVGEDDDCVPRDASRVALASSDSWRRSARQWATPVSTRCHESAATIGVLEVLRARYRGSSPARLRRMWRLIDPATWTTPVEPLTAGYGDAVYRAAPATGAGALRDGSVADVGSLTLLIPTARQRIA